MGSEHSRMRKMAWGGRVVMWGCAGEELWWGESGDMRLETVEYAVSVARLACAARVTGAPPSEFLLCEEVVSISASSISVSSASDSSSSSLATSPHSLSSGAHSWTQLCSS